MRANGNRSTVVAPGSAIYVDTENLRESDHAQNIVTQIIANWPADQPQVDSLSLYVRADKEALWRLWAKATFPALQVRVRGVQHFTNNRAKNSADLAITADAVADLITGQAAAVAVVSNDSDFGALFVKVNELALNAGVDPTPFLWITVPDAGALSAEIEQFIPSRFRWDLSTTPITPTPLPPAPALAAEEPPARPSSRATRQQQPAAIAGDSTSDETIAQELIRQLPLGRFRASDAQEVIGRRWPEHPAVGDPARFGQFLVGQIWPILQKRGVTMPRKSSPRTYEITSDAKVRILQPSSPPSNRSKATPEPTPAQLAAIVASHVDDDLFGATEARNAIKARWPAHPAASYTAAQFGAWFAKQLWPVMEEHGVVLASEKPRRYEMTPDARHRLISLA